MFFLQSKNEALAGKQVHSAKNEIDLDPEGCSGQQTKYKETKFLDISFSFAFAFTPE